VETATCMAMHGWMNLGALTRIRTHARYKQTLIAGSNSPQTHILPTVFHTNHKKRICVFFEGGGAGGRGGGQGEDCRSRPTLIIVLTYLEADICDGVLAG